MSNKKFSELDLLATAKGNAYIPVIDPDEALPENRAKRIMISTLTVGGEDNLNFAPYDPNKYYQSAAPDYVSYNGNIYQYINPTPAKGKTPNPNPTHANAAYWRLTSAGQVSHVQNTDTHTSSRTFEIGKVQGQLLDPEGNSVIAADGSTILVFGGADADKVAIRYVWETVGSEVIRKLQFSLNFDLGSLPVWTDFGSGGGAVPEPTPADAGKAIIANSLGEYILQSITATAGGTIEGAVQYRNAAGQVTGSDIFVFNPVTKVFHVGNSSVNGVLDVENTTSSITAKDGQQLTIALANGLAKAFVIKNKVTDKEILSVQTLASGQELSIVEAFNVDALILAPVKHRQAVVETAATTKAYFNLPNTLTPIDLDLLDDGNSLEYEASVLGVSDDGTVRVHHKFIGSAFKVGATIVYTNTNITPLPSAITAIGLEGKPGDVNNYCRIAITPASATATKWILRAEYMKY